MNYKRSIKLLQIEALLTSGIMVMPVANLLFADIGMSQFQVGLSQALFMAVAVLLDVPTGWAADRFSRKFSNAFGDLLVAGGFLLYASAHSFLLVVVSEVVIGAGIAFTTGADMSLLRAYTKGDVSHYRRLSYRLAKLRPLAEVTGVLVGGALAVHGIRWPFVATAGLFLLGAILSLFIKEAGGRRRSQHHPLKDMAIIAKYCLHGHKALAWRIFAGAVSSNSTHVAVWLFTPMLLSVGLPTSKLGYAWALSMILVSVGAGLVGKRQVSQKMVIVPLTLVVLSYIVMGMSLTTWTVGLYFVFSLVRGWYMAIMNPYIQELVPEDIQATALSVASMTRRLLYIPLVMLVNGFGSSNIQNALLVAGLLFAALTFVVQRGLHRYDSEAVV
jgi:MFS family permease